MIIPRLRHCWLRYSLVCLLDFLFKFLAPRFGSFWCLILPEVVLFDLSSQRSHFIHELVQSFQLGLDGESVISSTVSLRVSFRSFTYVPKSVCSLVRSTFSNRCITSRGRCHLVLEIQIVLMRSQHYSHFTTSFALKDFSPTNTVPASPLLLHN